MKINYRKTLKACYLGFITQAIAANFAPLLFIKFHTDYAIPFGSIALISTAFYLTQLVVDLFCAKFVDAIGYRKSVVASEVLSVLAWWASPSSRICARIRLQGSSSASSFTPSAAGLSRCCAVRLWKPVRLTIRKP